MAILNIQQKIVDMSLSCLLSFYHSVQPGRMNAVAEQIAGDRPFGALPIVCPKRAIQASGFTV